jgi:hypothetical protein
MSTWRDIVFRTSAPSFQSCDPNVYGGGTQVATVPNGSSAFARWDSTGKLLAYATALSSPSPSASSIYIVRTTNGALAAVSTRGGASNAPPSRITDLAAPQVNDRSAVLTWTAPADDGPSGRAAAYELRRSSQPLTDANFAAGVVVPISQAPKVAGASEQYLVTGLTPGTSYYFAIRALDDAGSASAVSNNVSVSTPAADTMPPAAIQDLAPGL